MSKDGGKQLGRRNKGDWKGGMMFLVVGREMTGEEFGCLDSLVAQRGVWWPKLMVYVLTLQVNKRQDLIPLTNVNQVLTMHQEVF